LTWDQSKRAGQTRDWKRFWAHKCGTVCPKEATMVVYVVAFVVVVLASFLAKNITTNEQ